MPWSAWLNADLEGLRCVLPGSDSVISFDVPADAEAGREFLNAGAFASLRWENDSVVVSRWNPEPRGATRAVFSALPSGQFALTSLGDSRGFHHKLEYNREEQLVRLVEARHARTYHVEYDSHSRIAGVTLEGYGAYKRISDYEYDALGNLVVARLLSGAVLAYEYDDLGQVVAERLPLGMTMRYWYDPHGRCIQVLGDGGFNEHHFTYLASESATLVTSASSSVTRYEWRADGRITRIHHPSGRAESFVYDGMGRLVERTRGGNTVGKYAYDARGDQVVSVDAAGRVTQRIFDNEHRLVRTTDALGRTYEYGFDASGRCTSTLFPSGAQWRREFNAAGDLEALITPHGASLRRTYDSHGFLQSLETSAGRWQFTVDAFGLVDSLTEPFGEPMRIARSEDGWPIGATWRDGAQLQSIRNVLGQVVEIIDPSGARWIRRYGLCGLLKERTTPTGQRVKLDWDTVPWRLNAIAFDDLNRREFRYDADGLLCEERSPAGRITTYTRDSQGAVVSREQGGQLTRYERDAGGEVVAILTDHEFVRYESDAVGRVTRVASTAASIGFTYDVLDRVVSESVGDSIVVQSTFDSTGRRNTRQVGSTRITFSWLDNRRLDKLTINEATTLAFTYDSGGREAFRTLVGTSAQLSRTWGPRGTLRRLTVGRGVTPALSIAYEWDKASRLLSMTEIGNRQSTFVHDADGRPINATYEDGSRETLTVDARENVSVLSRPGQSRAVFGLDDELLRTEEFTFDYDSRGRLLSTNGSRGVSRLSWNALDQLVEYVHPDGRSSRYAYDGVHRLIALDRPDGTAIRFSWDGDTLASTTFLGVDQSPISTIDYLIDPDSMIPVLVIRDGKALMCVPGQNGALIALIDEQGQITWQAKYTVFGALRHQAGHDVSRLRFPGQWADPDTGLYFNRHRWYDPQHGRYLSQDPLGVSAGFNLYAYVRNPLRDADPFGLAQLCAHLPPGATIVEDHSPSHLIYDTADGRRRMIFDARAGVTGAEANPGRNGTIDSLVAVTPDGVPFVHEGRHRGAGASQGDIIPTDKGGIAALPGHLDFPFSDTPAQGPGIPLTTVKIDRGHPADSAPATACRDFDPSMDTFPDR